VCSLLLIADRPLRLKNHPTVPGGMPSLDTHRAQWQPQRIAAGRQDRFLAARRVSIDSMASLAWSNCSSERRESEVVCSTLCSRGTSNAQIFMQAAGCSFRTFAAIFCKTVFVRLAQLRSRGGCRIDTHRAGLFGDALDKDLVSRLASRVSLERLRMPDSRPDVLRLLCVGLSRLNAQI
jgi:hypothetical protein